MRPSGRRDALHMGSRSPVCSRGPGPRPQRHSMSRRDEEPGRVKRSQQKGPMKENSAKKLGRKKEAVILALLSQRSVEEAARVTGVGARTLYRWMREPEFDAAYREAKRASFSQSIARMHQLSGAAVTTLGKAMLDSNTPPATKVRAADTILDHMAKAVELEDLEARLAQLERSAEIWKTTSGR